ncbi:hypothetical protein [Desulfosoma caldarium]|uniref:Solute:sodium symporter small subunit n=1 Tax=Desulfosoma caldarium TaxID=610254 RepID=A0A3N1UNV2_9BACT|nr:hypothetical protein [Desulfosoma caldarium]ROQ89551.1 hypothetical protein EDC27_3087 [Desulfosoma caldarium]
MFKGMPKIFWVGMLLLYGYFFLFFILEITVPKFPLAKFLGVPACYTYAWIIGLWVINLIVAAIFYRAEEAREDRLAKK